MCDCCKGGPSLQIGRKRHLAHGLAHASLTKLLLTVPILFSDTRFVLPGTGPFRAPLTIQRRLHLDLETSMEQAWLPAGVDGTAECWAFSPSMCQELADTLRAALPNQQSAVVELLAPWIGRLQCTADVAGQPFLRSTRHTHDSIQYMLLCDHGRSSTELKDPKTTRFP